MLRNEIFSSMVNFYHGRAYTSHYIFGFEFKGVVYMCHADSSVLPYVLCLDSASRGAGFSLRFKPNNNQKLILMKNAEALCSVEFFHQAVAESKYNAGEIFEKMVTEWYGQRWEKDNVPFTDDGDLTVDGVAYQIKFQKATFINEKQIARLRAKN